MNQFLAGVGKVLMFDGSTLIGVGKTNTETTFNYSISKEEIRAGAANALWGQFFHDSNLAVTITNAMFDITQFGANIGVDPSMGGIVWYETETKETIATGGVITLTHTPVAFEGSTFVWYKKAGDSNWSVGTAVNNTLTITGATSSDTYCIKYPWQNASAKNVEVKVQYIPKTMHIVVINDLFSGETSDVGSATKYGRIITDIPRFQLAGNMDLSLTASSAATMSLSGNALAVSSEDSCTDDPLYGTVTQEIFSANWKDEVVAIAVENSDIELASGETATLVVRVVYGGSIPSQRKDNSNFTFAVVSGNGTINASTGVITGGASGTTVYSVTLNDKTSIVGYATSAPAV